MATRTVITHRQSHTDRPQDTNKDIKRHKPTMDIHWKHLDRDRCSTERRRVHPKRTGVRGCIKHAPDTTQACHTWVTRANLLACHWLAGLPCPGRRWLWPESPVSPAFHLLTRLSLAAATHSILQREPPSLPPLSAQHTQCLSLPPSSLPPSLGLPLAFFLCHSKQLNP